MYMQNESVRGIAACEILPKQRGALPGWVGMHLDGGDLFRYTTETVSYTHLTLPTKLEV